MLALVWVGLAAAAGCSGDSAQPEDPATPEAGTDGAVEGSVAPDSGVDGASGSDAADAGSSDAGADASTDAGDDASADAGDDASDDAGDAGVDAGPPITYKHYDINHVLSTGASDAVANGASPPITTMQPFGNLSFDVGVMTAGTCNGNGCKVYQTPASFIPLKEGDKFFNYGVETMSSGLANQATVFASEYFAKVGLAGLQHDVLVSMHGRSGNEYWCLRQQTANVSPGANVCYYSAGLGYIPPFAEALMQVQDAKAIAAAAGKTYVVRAVTAIHGQGESDSNEQNFTFLQSTDGTGRRLLNYTDGLLDWQNDYQTKVREITGQAESIPMFISQFGTMTTPTSIIPQRQLDAHKVSNGKVILVTPNYPFPHYSDCNHYTNYSQRWLGAYFAKAYQRVVVEGGKWEPTRPLSIQRAGNIITVKYIVPVPPLVIDTVRVDASNDKFPVPPFYGFIFRDSTMSASITNVAVTAPDTVTITLSNAPTGANRILRYAFESQSPAFRCPGPTSGARGNIRDSDATVGYHTDLNGNPYELFNWSVAYQLDVP
ncbi:MAG: hypothetical protein KC657_31630 [Myxococcales bacterium]|nr:hypothetical protein [Myxococcales bacterium]